MPKKQMEIAFSRLFVKKKKMSRGLDGKTVCHKPTTEEQIKT
jgi:hypothetical protein